MTQLSRLATIAILLAIVMAAGCSTPQAQPDPAAPPRLPAAAAPKPAPKADPAQAANAAWSRARHSATEDSYRAFASKYPRDRHAGQATSLAAGLAWRHAQRAWDRGDGSGFQQFVDRYPHDRHANEARRMTEPVHVTLADAVQRGWVRSRVTGNGLQSVDLTVTRRARRPLDVSIPAGTFFVSAGSSQNMVACADSSADLSASRSADVTVSAACANFYEAEPDQSNRFSVKAEHPDPMLRRLLAVIGRQNPDQNASQLAIWSITDNPSRDDVAGHIVPTPSDDDYHGAAHLLRAAGIKPASRQMFRSGS